MRTPSSALPAWPQGLALGRGRPFAAAALASFFDFNFTTFLEAVLDLTLPLAFAVLRFLVAIVRSPDLLWCPCNRARVLPYFLRTALCGLSLPMRPLSVPAAASTARLSSSGVVA